jgi:hypothetical protein
MPVLTAIDVLGVQRFVFLSNRLRDVVTGSYLVHWCTSAEGALRGLIPTDKILLAGGGNAIVETRSMEEARSFAARYIRLLHDEAPGLEVALVHKEYDDGSLARTLLDIQIELARTKTERFPSAPLLGLSVAASCKETGLPASGFDSSEPTIPLSKEILKRRDKLEEAILHWEAYLENRSEFAFPMELDQLGRTVHDTSLIGVVHVDGNSVGRKIREWLVEKSESGTEDTMVRREYRAWSKAIDQLGKDALQAAVNRICQRVQKSVEDGREKIKVTGKPAKLAFELRELDGCWMLPVRPILLGGDDLTFVCDGRIALDLAETALRVFDTSNIPYIGKITACAGVAVVRVHAPFARAYDLAEKLCGSAKHMLKENNVSGCALDWHIGISRPGETVEGIRERQYRTNGCWLTCRPYRLCAGKDETETWEWLTRTLLDDPMIGLREGAWSGRRNKVKAFAELAREGPKSVHAALEAWKVVDKNLQLPKPIAGNGFFAETRTPLIDALELLDMHLTLDAVDNVERR